MKPMENMVLTDKDLAEIRKGVEVADVRGDAVLRYWSADSGILWLGLHHGGRLASWMTVPATTKADADRQVAFYVEMVAKGLAVRAEAADALTDEVLRKATEAKH